MRGRRPKPTALRKLEGNPGKRPFNEREPKPAPGEPEMPDLSREAAAEWKRLVPILLRLGILTVADGAALGMYCSSYARYLQAEREIGRLKSLNSDKARRLNTISKEAMKLAKNILVEFGLTPASRPRLASFGILPTERTDSDDPASKFFDDPPIQ